MKYIIKNSDLLIDNKLHPEGSEVELSKEKTKGIEDFLIPIESERLPAETSVKAGHTVRSRSISEDSTKTKKNNKGNKK